MNPAARARMQDRLTCTCTITRPGTGTATVDPDTLVATKPAPVTVWTGPCTVGNPTGTGVEDQRAGLQLAGQAVPVAVPVAATGIRRGDTLTVTAVGPDGDPDLIGVPLTVDQVDLRSRVALRRLRCVDTRPTPGRIP